MSIIEASSVGIKTMADNTLRLTVDIEPRFAKQAFELFGERGTAMALAALKVGAQPDPQPDPEKLKGGYAAEWLGTKCNEKPFQAFLYSISPAYLVSSSQEAAEVVRTICRVTSRAHIDHLPEAKERFDRLIRIPYGKWIAVNGVRFTAQEYA